MINKILAFTILLLGVYLTVATDGVSGIMCYSCNSYYNKSCSDPMGKNVTMVNCKGEYYCSKIIFRTQNITITSRGCDPKIKDIDTCSAINSTLFQAYKGDLSNFECYLCSKDNCNSAVTLSIPVLAVLITLVITKLF